jgi:3-isopropylmalate/(R)-2-methylmalate dehydratase small subunit
MQMKIRGRVWKYGDNVNTDVIIPGRYAAHNLSQLGEHCMEDLDPYFIKKVSKGDILVAGRNFGCGSSREHAPIAIQAAGISCVIAKSFARIFFRNAINMAFPVLETPDADRIEEGDELRIDIKLGRIDNVTKKESYLVKPLPEFLENVFFSGGLLNSIAKNELGVLKVEEDIVC